MSKIEVHPSLVVARKVVRELEKIIPKNIANNCRIASWSNCREQGLCIECFSGLTDFSKKVCIAECRNSDSILVVHGTNYDFDMQTNQPSEEIYQKNRRYFDYQHFKDAAKHILTILK